MDDGWGKASFMETPGPPDQGTLPGDTSLELFWSREVVQYWWYYVLQDVTVPANISNEYSWIPCVIGIDGIAVAKCSTHHSNNTVEKLQSAP